MVAPEATKEVGRRLLRWYAAARRDLPWRRRPTPYRVWVSEIMLQQTRVETVVDYYGRFMRRFPTLKALAESPVEDVLAAWSGLGYYRRARLLHAGARHVREQHRSRFPGDYHDALSVPGVGPYTAGAILSIAYNRPVPAVDGNVERVLSRLFLIAGHPKKPAAARRLRELARALIPQGKAAAFNQAIMELGAKVCTPRAPACSACPLADLCAARQEGVAEDYPHRAAKRDVEPVTFWTGVIPAGSRYLLERVSRRSFLNGMWMFPFAAGEEPGVLLDALRAGLGTAFDVEGELEPVRHSITFRRITARPLMLRPRGRMKLADRERFQKARLEQLGDEIAVSSLALKIRGRIWV